MPSPGIHTNQRSSFASATRPETTPAAGNATRARAPLSWLAGRAEALAADVAQRAVHIGLVLARFALGARTSTETSPVDSRETSPAPVDSAATNLRVSGEELPALEEGYRTAAEAAIKGILDRNPFNTLRSLFIMEERFAPLRELHTRMPGHVESEQDGAKKRGELIGQVLSGLSDEDAMNAFVAVHSQDSLALLSGLFEASATITAQGGEYLGRMMQAMGSHFEDISGQLANDLANRGMIPRDDTGRPISPGGGEKVTADRMPWEMRAAFGAVLGINCELQSAPRFGLLMSPD